ncbi:MAG TPA: hypothetical protein DCO89_02735 [Clostridiales bacterium]|nr:hypothetical protein [Clostridiales bacterium]
MSKHVCFIGHRDFVNENTELKDAIEKEILSGASCFTIGTHGKFDEYALYYCKELSKKYNDIEINVVITSLNQIKKQILYNDEWGIEYFTPYKDVKTIMYNIEEEHFKKRIIESNKKMIDNNDTLICYINPNKKSGGACATLKYAIKKNIKIINIYK